MQTLREHLEYLTRMLADDDLEFYSSAEWIEWMQKEKAELEAQLDRTKADGMT